MRRAVLRLSLVALLTGPTLVLTASPCAACSCAPQSPKQLFRDADAAFVGSVVGQEAIDQTTTVQTFAVGSVYKGPLGATVQVIAPIGSGGGDTCGVLFGAGKVAVILHRQGDGWTTDVCSRITVTKLAAVGPSPVHPSPEPSATPPPPPTPSDGGSGGLSWPGVVIGLLLGVAAIAAALSLGGRRDRDRASPLPAAGEEDAPDPPGSSD